jgi:hypothetical protein
MLQRAHRQLVAAISLNTGSLASPVSLVCLPPSEPPQQLCVFPPRRQLAALKKEGKELPNDMAALEARLGTWRSYKTEHDTADGGSAAAVPLAHLDAKGKPCGLAGMPVGKNTK